MLWKYVLRSWYDIESTMFDATVSQASQPVFSSPVWFSQGFRYFSLDRKQIPKAYSHLALVADFFSCSLLSFCLYWTAPQEFDRRTPLPLHAVCCVSLLLFSSLPLYVNGIHIVFLMILLPPVEQLHFHRLRHRDILMELSRCDEWSTG